MSQALPPSSQINQTPPSERRPTVFISYSHEDKEFADRLKQDLTRAEHPCWIDTSAIKGGDEWMSAIATGILDSYAVVVIVTGKALGSRYVRDEILWARTNDKQIIPLIREDVFKDQAFFPLISYQGVPMLDGDYEGALRKLLDALPAPASIAPVAVSPDEPRKWELDYLERLRFEELLNAEKYTPLGGASQRKRPEMRAVFELMRLGKDRDEVRETKRFEDAVAEIRRLRRAVLLGEPGGGKTTTIWKLAAELVADALADARAPIPLLVRLGRWTEAEQPLEDFIASQLGDLGTSLAALLKDQRAALLLDGLNELPTSQRDAKYPQVKRLIEQHPKLIAVVSCRELDYTVDLGFDRINITPLDPMRIRDFVVRYLEAEKGEALFWRLGGGEEVRAVWEVWERAGASFDLFWTATEIPKENPNVYGVTSGQHDQIWREKVRGKHSLMELARNPYMLLMLTSVYAEQDDLPENRGELFRLFVETLLKRERIPEEEQGPLTDGLAKLAYEMHTRRADGEEGDALTVLPRADVAATLNERLLYLVGSASILSVGEQVGFTHQLLQEYFAALSMDIKIHVEEMNAYDIWLSDRWWNRTNWEEAAILLAGLYSDDCSPVIDWVNRGNPEVAAQCVARSGANMAEATRERLRAEWISRLTDLKNDPNPLSRAAVGRALGIANWDNRKGVGIICNSRGVSLPDIDWVEIPGGEFPYGHKDESDNPPQKLKLPTFHIARYPVTYAQFQTFLDDPEGFTDPRWFDGVAAKEEDRPLSEQAFKFANHPRERVNWYGAIAFCRWLSWRLGGGYELKKVDDWAVRLPTEFEWEKAARGTDARIYPYEGDFDSAKGNTSETEIGQTSAVGIFPNGASPYGVMDMSGNVWEWCLSTYEKPAREAQKENLGTDKSRVLRGGSFASGHGGARAVFRVDIHPALRGDYCGFRLFCGLRPPSF